MRGRCEVAGAADERGDVGVGVRHRVRLVHDRRVRGWGSQDGASPADCPQAGGFHDCGWFKS